MRFIDADALKECYHESSDTRADGTMAKADYTSIRKMIDAQPTAYDVEAKIAELRRKMEAQEKRFEETHIVSALSAMRAYEDAISIVRGKE